MTSREEFLKKLGQTFKIEAKEGLANITSNLIELEKDQEEERKAGLIEAIFREAHSLKGAARAVNASEIENICHALESVFSALKNKLIPLHPGLFDLFHQTVNLISEVLNSLEDEIGEPIKERIGELIMNLLEAETGIIPEVVQVKKESLINTETVQIQEPSIKKEPNLQVLKSENTIRISVEKLDSLLNQAEEMLTLKQIFGNFGDKLSSITHMLNLLIHESSGIIPIARDIQQIQDRAQQNTNISYDGKDIKQMIQFLEWSNSMIKSLEDELSSLTKLNQEEGYDSGVKIESLFDEVKKIISVPFSGILDVFPKAARDLSKDIGKLVNLEIVGSEIEIDRRILEELRNPLIHLLRNAIDHGIEKPEERKRKNKPQAGNITAKVENVENGQIEITFTDDGAGVDLEKVRKKYAKQEQIAAKQAAETDERILLDYLFKSGVSTAEMITDLSGRGLGLAIVREKIEQIGGTVSVKTQKEIGTEFKIRIPLSLVTFRGVHIKVGAYTFVVPTSKISKVLRLEKTELHTVENKATIPWNDGIIPLIHLTDVLEIPFKESESNFILIIVLGSGDNYMGYVIDEILDEDVILVKKFNSQLKRVRNISGATVTGSGKVIPILNVTDLMKSSVNESSVSKREIGKSAEIEKKSILVVEDSITSRMLLKNILETAGYKVSTAIDGMDGYTKLKTEQIDLVVSDVDMPRMSGLDMTAKIRSDKSIAEIPIVLVTSLSKREDRERGMEVGANAYIVKSNFDQSNLLEVVDRLIGNE